MNRKNYRLQFLTLIILLIGIISFKSTNRSQYFNDEHSIPYVIDSLNTQPNSGQTYHFEEVSLIKKVNYNPNILAGSVDNNLLNTEKQMELNRTNSYIIIFCSIGLFLLAAVALFFYFRQRKMTKRFLKQSRLDLMTECLNRGTTEHLIENYFEKHNGERVAFIMVDVDNLKGINDLRGHAAGDEAILGLAKILKEVAPPSSILGRIGGDEFLLFVGNDPHNEEIISLVESIKQLTIDSASTKGLGFLHCSIGISFVKIGETSIDEGYKQADEALYSSKIHGKNTYTIYCGSVLSNKQNVEVNDEEVKNVSYDKSTNSVILQDKIADSLHNVGVFVIEEATLKILYFNKVIKEKCPNIMIGASCHDVLKGPCSNCPLKLMKENATCHTILYSGIFGETVEFSAKRFLFNGTIPAFTVSIWPKNISAISDTDLYHAIGKEPVDFLTGGLTRSGFINSIERMRKNGINLLDYSVVYLNILNFKAINELFKYKGGNQLLVSLYNHFMNSSLSPLLGARKESDHLVFLIKKENLDYSLLNDLMTYTWHFNSKELKVYCASGVYEINSNNLEGYKMIDYAILAYKMETRPFNQTYSVFKDNMIEEYIEQHEAVLKFDEMLEQHKFLLVYQPVIHLRSGRVSSIEALCRYKDSNGVITSPGRFIPSLEKMGLVTKLSKYILDEIEVFVKKYSSKGVSIPSISMNLSYRDTTSEDFLSHLYSKEDLIKDKSIQLQLMEELYYQGGDLLINEFEKLHQAGVKMILDNFGLHFTRFSMQQNFPMKQVKLNRGLVGQLSTNTNVRKLVNSLISMCHDLGIEVVATGVENQEQLDAAKELHCDYVQGFFLSKPLEEKYLIEYLESKVK